MFNVPSLQWKIVNLGFCYLLFLTFLKIYLIQSKHSGIFGACDLYKIYHIAYFLLLLFKCEDDLKLYSSNAMDVPCPPLE